MSDSIVNVVISMERVGARIYVTGNTWPVKGNLKAAGCHWDKDRKQWWIGAAKAEALAAVVAGLNGPAVEKKLSEDTPVLGRVTYKNRSYYVVNEGRGGEKLHLASLDGSIDFWADASACEWTKRYEAREVWDGRPYSGRYVTQRQTIGSLRRFSERNREAKRRGYTDAGHQQAERSGRCRAPGCGAAPAPGCHGYCRSCHFDEFDS